MYQRNSGSPTSMVLVAPSKLRQPEAAVVSRISSWLLLHRLRGSPAILNLPGFNTVQDLTLAEGFPFRLGNEADQIRFIRVRARTGGWTRTLRYAEFSAIRTAEHWSDRSQVQDRLRAAACDGGCLGRRKREGDVLSETPLWFLIIQVLTTATLVATFVAFLAQLRTMHQQVEVARQSTLAQNTLAVAQYLSHPRSERVGAMFFGSLATSRSVGGRMTIASKRSACVVPMTLQG